MCKNKMTDELDDIKIVESTNKFNAEDYEGFRSRIAKVSKKQVIDYFPDKVTTDSEGSPVISNPYDPNSTEMKWVIEIETKPLPVVTVKDGITIPVTPEKLVEIPLKDGSVKNITVTHQFGLQEINNNGNTEVVISKNPKAKLWAFMRAKGVNKVSELKDMLVTLTAKPSKKEGDNRKYLKIVV